MSAEDLGEHKQVDELIEALSNCSTIGIYIVQDKRFCFANPQFQKQTGYRLDELLGMDPRNLVLPEDREMVRRKAAKMLKGERTIPFEHRSLDKAGQIQWILESVVSIQYRGRRASLGNFMDITGLKRAEEERVLLVREHTARVEAEAARQQTIDILESITDAFVAIDHQGRFTYVNKEAQRLLRRRSEDLVGRNGGVEFPEALGSKFHEECKKVISQQVTVGFEAFYAPLGIWLDVRAYPSKDGLSVYFRDVTERKEAERLREEYIALISHDLRSPLASLMGQAQWQYRLLTQKGLEREASGADSILKSARKINDMIQDLVESSRLESGFPELYKEPMDPLHLVAEIVERVGSPEDRARLQVECPECVPPVAVDAGRIERVIVNLITNAAKYSSPDTPIVIHIGRSEDEAIISVADRGIGIAPADLPHIFQRFYRAATGKRIEGLGLGLYIARMLVEAHGGRVWVESEVGVGSTFHLGLPLA